MKALTTLKEAYRVLNLDKGDEYRYNVGILLKEAIEELELLSNTLQLKKQKKTCKNCKHSIVREEIMNCIKLEEIIQTYPQEPYWINKKDMSKFGCNKWESKQ